jgi:hypothetical protein
VVWGLVKPLFLKKSAGEVVFIVVHDRDFVFPTVNWEKRQQSPGPPARAAWKRSESGLRCGRFLKLLLAVKILYPGFQPLPTASL